MNVPRFRFSISGLLAATFIVAATFAGVRFAGLIFFATAVPSAIAALAGVAWLSGVRRVVSAVGLVFWALVVIGGFRVQRLYHAGLFPSKWFELWLTIGWLSLLAIGVWVPFAMRRRHEPGR